MVTSFTAAQLAETLWRLAWTSDAPDPVFRVYRDGILVAETADLFLLVGVEPGGSPVFEVLDDPAADPQPAYPDQVTLAWYAAAGSAEYRVDELVDAAWAERARVRDDGSGYFTWASGRLADATVHQFRVVPVGTNGNDGTPVTFAVPVVRVPDVPAVAYAYDAGTGQVTISAA